MDTKDTAPDLSKLADALSKAQGEMVPPVKNKLVDFLDKSGRRVHYRYAELSAIIEAVKVPFKNNGLSFTQTLGIYPFPQEFYGLKTRLMHVSGAFQDSWYPLPNPREGIKAQEFGSALTYARRYSLEAIAGIAGEEDDDGGGAPDIPPTPQPRPKDVTPQQPLVPALSISTEPASLLDQLLALIEKKGIHAGEMPDIIRRVLGREVKAKDCSPEELRKVIAYIDKFSRKK